MVDFSLRIEHTKADDLSGKVLVLLSSTVGSGRRGTDIVSHIFAAEVGYLETVLF